MNEIKSLDLAKARNVWIELRDRRNEVEREIELLVNERFEIGKRISELNGEINDWIESEVFV